MQNVKTCVDSTLLSHEWLSYWWAYISQPK